MKRLNRLDRLNIQNEIIIHQNLSHPYVVKLIDFLQENSRVYMILEYIPGGNLFSFINRTRKLSKELICKIFGQTVHALKYIHQEGFILRDLKPENILLDQQNNIKGISSSISIKLFLVKLRDENN